MLEVVFIVNVEVKRQDVPRQDSIVLGFESFFEICPLPAKFLRICI